MPTYGVTSTGFVAKTLEEIRLEYEADFSASFGSGVNLEPESVNGQLIGIMAERDAELWEALADVYASLDPDQTSGAALDALLGVTGTVRLPARYSEGTVVAVGVDGTVLSTGRVFSVAGSGVRFATTAPATLASLPAWAAAHAYAAADMVALGDNAYFATVAGTSAGSGGPAGSGTAIVDGGVTWRFLGSGVAAATVPVQAQEVGPKPAYAWTLTGVETAVAGLNGVVNPLDVELGADVETDAAARIRREAELQASGNAALEAVRGDVLQVADVTSVSVFENDSPTTTNIDGMPPNSIEVVVRGGDDQAIREAIFASKAAGITAYGATTGTVEDQEGIEHSVSFTRPTDVPVYIAITMTTAEDFPIDGATQVREALVEWGDLNLNLGDDVIQSQLYAPVFSVPGITDVSLLALGLSAWPATTDNLTIGSRELAVFDTSRIRINGV